MYKASEWEIFYSKIDNKSCDFLAYNTFSEEFYHLENVDISSIYYTDKEGNESTPMLVSDDILERLLSTNEGSTCCGFPWEYDNEPQYKRSKELISKELVHKAIRCEIPFKQIEEIRCSNLDMEYDDYFNFDAYMDIIHRFMRNEISEQDYIDWAVICMKALYSNDFKKYSPVEKIYSILADMFDGHAFLGYDRGEKASFCREMIADLKYYNHRIENIKSKKKTPFYNENKIIVYTVFDHCNQNNIYYRLCVVDKKNKRFKIGYAINPDFLEEINYTISSLRDFDGFTSRYYHYIEDESIDFSKYVGTVK